MPNCGILSLFSSCLTRRQAQPSNSKASNYKTTVDLAPEPSPSETKAASSLLSLLLTAEKPGIEFKQAGQNIVRPCGWTDWLAQRLLDGLVDALSTGQALGIAAKEAYDRVSGEAEAFARAHPVLYEVLVVVIAIGIFAVLMPWVVEALGFGELGPVAGE